MLIEVHYGDDGVLLANGNCRGIHLIDFIRSRCDLPSTTTIDLCLATNGEPFRLASFDSTILPFEREDFPLRLKCVLTRIDEQGTYIPLSNNPKLINSEFLAKLKKATSTKTSTKVFTKVMKLPVVTGSKLQQQQQQQQQSTKRRRSLKSVALAATFITVNRQ